MRGARRTEVAVKKRFEGTGDDVHAIEEADLSRCHDVIPRAVSLDSRLYHQIWLYMLWLLLGGYQTGYVHPSIGLPSLLLL